MSDEQQPAEKSETGTFTPPATQEDLNRIIADRLRREREKFADYATLREKASKLDAAEEAAKSELEKALARAEAAESQIQKFETQKQIAQWKSQVSKDTGVPAEALSGTSLEEITAHAEVLKPLIQDANRGPVVSTAADPPNNTALNGDGLTDSLKKVLGIP